MPEIISTEQVRADQVKEGDRVWWNHNFQPIVSVREWESDGIRLYVEDDDEIFPEEFVVLRQAAPASPVVTDEMRRRGALALANMDLHVHSQLANEREGRPFSFGELADACLHAALASQENTGADDAH